MAFLFLLAYRLPNGGSKGTSTLTVRLTRFTINLQDIPASENTDHYMFQNLEPNKNYSISVTMRNGVGEGPPAVTYVVTTPEPAGRDKSRNLKASR